MTGVPIPDTTPGLLRALLQAWDGLPGGAPQLQALLEAAARRGDPALLGAMLAFVWPATRDGPNPVVLPRAPAATADAQAALHRAWQRAWPFESARCPAALRAVALDAVRRLLAGLPPDAVPVLDAGVRALGRVAWSVAPADTRALWVAAPHPDTLVDGPARTGLAAVLASHGNGWLRQAAVRMLATADTPQALWFVLWRLADPVAPVRDAAQAALAVLLARHGARAVVDALPLLARLRDSGRVDGAARLAVLQAALASTEGRALLLAALQRGTPRTRREAIRWLDAPGPPAPDLIDGVLRVHDPMVRGRLVDWERRLRVPDPIAAAGLRLRLAADRHAALRAAGLRALVDCDDPDRDRHLRAALLDRASGVRRVARFALARMQPALDVAAIARHALERDGAVDVGAIAALGESGTIADAGPLLRHLRGPARGAAAALRAAATLDAEGTRGALLRALADPRARVARIAFARLPRRLDEPLAAPLALAWARAVTPASQQAVALAMLRLPPWPAAIALLHATAGGMGTGRRAALAALGRWSAAPRAAYGPEPCPPHLRPALDDALHRASALLPPTLLLRLR